jgi:hypothetical protein
MRSKLPGRVKREAFSHLTIGFVHPLLVTFSILFVPYLYFMNKGPVGGIWFVLNPLSVLLTGGATVIFYVTGQYFRQHQWKEGFLWLAVAPLVLAFGLALSVTCCVAVIEGLLTKGGEFVRTPKGSKSLIRTGMFGRLRSRTMFLAITVIEAALGLGMLAGALYFGRNDMLAVAGTLLVKAIGFLGLAAMSTPDLFPRQARA